MQTISLFSIAPAVIFAASSFVPAYAQEPLGTSMGIPQSSPPVLWPRGMSIESLSPQNLYPNGPQFGLGNTSGGFGSTGTGPISGVGLAQRAVNPLVQQEMQSSNSFVNKTTILEIVERSRSQTTLSAVTNLDFRVQMGRTSLSLHTIEVNRPLIQPYSIPNADAVLHDQASTTDSILRTGL